MKVKFFVILLLLLIVTLLPAGTHEFDYSELHPYLYDITLLAPDDSYFIVGDGSNWIRETGATARSSLGLGLSNTAQFGSLTIDEINMDDYGITHGIGALFIITSTTADVLQISAPSGIVQIGSSWTALGQTCNNLGTVTAGALGAAVTQTEWDAAYTHVSNDGTDHSLLGATAGTASASLALIVDANKDIDLDGGDITSTGQAAFGTGIAAGNHLRVLTPIYALNTTGHRWAFNAMARGQAYANTANTLGGFVGGAQTYGTYNFTGTVYGLLGQLEHVGTGTVANAYGLWGNVLNFPGIAGTIQNAKVMRATLDAEDGTVDFGYMFAAETAAVDEGTLETIYAFHDAGQTNATNNWGFYGLSADNYFAGKIALGQVDKNEYITGENDNYVDIGATTAVRINTGLIIPSGTTPAPAVEGALFLDTDAGANGTLVMYSNSGWRTVAAF